MSIFFNKKQLHNAKQTTLMIDDNYIFVKSYNVPHKHWWL